MFLSGLPEPAKESYYKLAYYLMNSDNKASEEELQVMRLYELEMDINLDFDLNNILIADEIRVLSALDTTSKKQVCFELISLAISDLEYSEDEIELISFFAKELGITLEDQSILKDCAEIILSTYRTLESVFGR